MCIVMTMGSTYEYNRYYSIASYNAKPPGIYFENYGRTRLIGAEYKLINYLSLEEYDKKYANLGERINNIERACVTNNTTKTCTKGNFIVKQFFNEINAQRERMYISLGKYEDDIKDVKNRVKRGLVNIIGTAMNTLFGVCDDNCVKETNDSIKSIEESETHTLHMLKSQTTIVKSAVEKIGMTVEKTNEMYKEVTDKLEEIEKRIKTAETTEEKMIELLEMTEIQNIYTALTNQFAYETSTLSQIVTAARGGVIHASLITPKEIASTLKEISHRLKGKLNIPMGTQPSELYELNKITKLTVFYENKRIVFITRIPLVTDIELTLFNAIPIPMTEIKQNKTIKLIITPENPYIAITKDRRQFTTFTDIQLESCKETSIYRVCNAYQPIQENNGQQTCEIELFNKPETAPKSCQPLITEINKNIYHKLKNQNSWIYTVVNDTLVVSCTELQEPQIHRISGEGIIQIFDNSCTITGKYIILTAVDHISNGIYTDFLPQTDMKELFNLITDRVNLIKTKGNDNKQKKKLELKNLHEVSKSLDDIEEQINNEEERRYNKKQREEHSYLYCIIIGLIIFILVIILISCIIYWIKNREVSNEYAIMKYIRPIGTRKNRNKSTERNIQPIDRERIEKIYNTIQSSRSPSPR